MSGQFAGFPDRLTYLPVPTIVFGSLLREIDDLTELKLTLHAWRLLQQQKGQPRYLRRSVLRADRALLLALRAAAPTGEPAAALDRALERAVERGTLAAVALRGDQGEETCYFLNNPANRRLIEQLERGEASLGPFEPVPPAALPAATPRPGIFELYEQNVGLLTPLLAEELSEAELRYPPDWIEDAFREAVAYNKRNWRYIRRILENWTAHGRGERGENRRHPEPPEDPGKYLQGRYGRLVQR